MRVGLIGAGNMVRAIARGWGEPVLSLLESRDYDTPRVRREVTSPGGSTARGLDALERAGVRAAFQAAMDRVCEMAA
jgi:pyrroline-5-carboxylate reductase